MKLALFAIIALLPGLALAHIGSDAGIHHGSAFFRGFVHPFTGLDHLLAMISVGIWSMQSFADSHRSACIVPLAFAGLLLAGGAAGFAGLHLPLVEPMIAASVLVLGLFFSLRVRLPLLAGAAMVGVFALFHGIAHGSELPAAHALAALSGMVTGTLLLHLTGMLLGRYVLAHNIWPPRIAGSAVAATGLGLLAGAF